MGKTGANDLENNNEIEVIDRGIHSFAQINLNCNFFEYFIIFS